MKHRYLFTLEVAPVEAGRTYDELPSHLTIISRFLSELPSSRLDEVVNPVFEQTGTLELVFGEITKLGPKKFTVHAVEYSNELRRLHDELRDILGSLNVDYEYPQFIGEGHKPHVTRRDGAHFGRGDRQAVQAVCLVEVVGGRRIIRSKFALGAGRK